jgi:hypothetical protein
MISSTNRIAKEDMTTALSIAKDAWKEVFFKDGFGKKFDKYTIQPKPEAIATIAAEIYKVIRTPPS